jgi:transcriptional regulator with XRE-family HTH domain
MTKYTAEQLVMQGILSRNIGTLLKELREQYDLTQYQVALGAGTHQTKIGNSERGEHMPTVATIVQIIMGIGIARARREICNDECPCRYAAENHTAEEIPDGS